VIHRQVRFTTFLLLFFCCIAAAQPGPPVEYKVSLKDAPRHVANVLVTAETEAPELDVQLPAWNALYQIRDFARNVLYLKARDASGQSLPVIKVDKTTWHIGGGKGPVLHRVMIEYQIVLDQPGPFGAQLGPDRAFLNPAQVLVYPIGQKDRPITLQFTDVPPGWKLATPLIDPDSQTAQPSETLHARNYDQLVDSPCDLGAFADYSFDQDGAKYRVVIDGDAKNYKPAEIIGSLKRITAAEVAWMKDHPFNHYLFIYYIPEGPAGGGMEHAYSTAIGISAQNLNSSLAGFESVSAHEFFHLWNVKRIRPQSLEPIDYTRENYTRALWFSEGVTNTVAELILLRAGLLDESAYLERLASAITTLQNRPAHRTQSAEESSLDTWFDGYPSYRTPERSINYYNKGEILGVLLDLKIRQDSRGRKSLRDLFQSMNQQYARQGRFFADSDGVRASAEMLTSTDLREFFQRYVAGTDELPFAELFATVGLKLSKQTRGIADLGLTALRNFDGPLLVSEVTGAAASAAGIRVGDEIVQLDGKLPGPDFSAQIASRRPGETVHLTLRRGKNVSSVRLTLESKATDIYKLEDLVNITNAQRSRREAWLASEDEPAASSSTSGAPVGQAEMSAY
jgi:predicted metalloprotease with PDZ domain